MLFVAINSIRCSWLQVAVDNDGVAVQAARENAHLNDASSQMTCTHTRVGHSTLPALSLYQVASVTPWPLKP